MITQGLIIREPWIGYILTEGKTWEMRPRRTLKRGPLALIRKGSGLVVATATIVDSLSPLTRETMARHFDKHYVPAEEWSKPDYNWFIPWVLADVHSLRTPVPYQHPSGAQNFVNLEPTVIQAIAQQGQQYGRPNGNRSERSHSFSDIIARKNAEESERVRRAGPARPVRATATSRRQMLMPDVSLSGSAHELANAQAAANTAVTASRSGNKLHVDIVLDDGMPLQPAKSPGWIEAMGMLAATLAMICMLGFGIHLALGLASSSISAFAAFKWLVPMAISVFVATFLGQGHLLENAFKER